MSAWDGFVTIHLQSSDCEDHVVIRAAPFLILPCTAIAQKIYVAGYTDLASGFPQELSSLKVEYRLPQDIEDQWAQDQILFGLSSFVPEALYNPLTVLPVVLNTPRSYTIGTMQIFSPDSLRYYVKSTIRGPSTSDTSPQTGYVEFDDPRASTASPRGDYDCDTPVSGAGWADIELYSRELSPAFGGNVLVMPPITESGTNQLGTIVMGSTAVPRPYSGELLAFLKKQRSQCKSLGGNETIPLVKCDFLDVGHVDEVAAFIPWGNSGDFRYLWADMGLTGEIAEHGLTTDIIPNLQNPVSPPDPMAALLYAEGASEWHGSICDEEIGGTHTLCLDHGPSSVEQDHNYCLRVFHVDEQEAYVQTIVAKLAKVTIEGTGVTRWTLDIQESFETDMSCLLNAFLLASDSNLDDPLDPFDHNVDGYIQRKELVSFFTICEGDQYSLLSASLTPYMWVYTVGGGYSRRQVPVFITCRDLTDTHFRTGYERLRDWLWSSTFNTENTQTATYGAYRLPTALGILPEKVLRLPAIYAVQPSGPWYTAEKTGRSFMPQLVNLQPVSIATGGTRHNHVLLPKPFGPRIDVNDDHILDANDKDIFELYIEIILKNGDDATSKIRTTFLDDYSYYHLWSGNVHCGTSVRHLADPVFSSWWLHDFVTYH